MCCQDARDNLRAVAKSLHKHPPQDTHVYERDGNKLSDKKKIKFAMIMMLLNEKLGVHQSYYILS